MYYIFIIMGIVMFFAAILLTIYAEKKEASLIFPIVVIIFGVAYLAGGIVIYILENKPRSKPSTEDTDIEENEVNEVNEDISDDASYYYADPESPIRIIPPDYL